jgi:hypothetical protein
MGATNLIVKSFLFLLTIIGTNKDYNKSLHDRGGGMSSGCGSNKLIP